MEILRTESVDDELMLLQPNIEVLRGYLTQII